MVRVIDANATYTGGGIYIYTGQLDDGTFFMTNTEYLDYIMVLDADPEENWDDNCDEQWQNEHMVVEHYGQEATDILKEAMKYIIDNQPTGNYSVCEVEDALNSLKQETELRERMMAVKAMEFLARQVNDEGVFNIWLMCGVADGDIEYGDFTIHSGVETDPAYDYASDPDTFSALMATFLRTMSSAYKNGGLWCGNVVSDN